MNPDPEDLIEREGPEGASDPDEGPPSVVWERRRPLRRKNPPPPPAPGEVKVDDPFAELLWHEWDRAFPPVLYAPEPHIPGTTGLPPFDLEGFDVDELMRRMRGVPLRWWPWLLRRLFLFIRFLGEIEKRKGPDGRLEPDKDGHNPVKDLMNEIFGVVDTPLGPDGLTYGGSTRARFDRRGCAEDGSFTVDISELVGRALEKVLTGILTAVIGRILPPGLARELAEDIASDFAGNVVAELELVGTFRMEGMWTEVWRFRRGEPVPDLDQKCEEAADVAYGLTDAIPVDAIAAVARLQANLDSLAESWEKTRDMLEPDSALEDLFDFLKDPLNNLEDLLESAQGRRRFLRGEIEPEDLGLPDPGEVEDALEALLDGLSNLGEVGGLKLVDEPRSGQLPPPPLHYHWARNIIFNQMAGPDVDPHLPAPTNEVYPVAIINAIVVPPGSEYFLQQLHLTYNAWLDAGFSSDPLDALGRAGRKTAENLPEIVKNRVLEKLREMARDQLPPELRDLFQ